MTQALLNWMKTHVLTHVAYLVVLAVVLIAGRAFLQEHDARLQADAEVKTAETTIADLQKQQSAVAAAASKQVIVLQRAAAAVRTPEAAVQALTNPTTVAEVTPENAAPIVATAVPDAPAKVETDALPLYQTLNVCKQTEVRLNACTVELGQQKQIDGQKDAEITALKKKPGFWHRVLSTAKQIGIGVLIGAAGAGVAAHGL